MASKDLKEISILPKELDEANQTISKYLEHRCGFIPQLQKLKDKLRELERSARPGASQKISRLCKFFTQTSNEYTKLAYVNAGVLEKPDSKLSSFERNWRILFENYPAAPVLITRCEFQSTRYVQGIFKSKGVVTLLDPDAHSIDSHISCLYTNPVEMFFLTKVYLRYIVLKRMKGVLGGQVDKIFHATLAELKGILDPVLAHDAYDFYSRFETPSEDLLALIFKKYLFARLRRAELLFSIMTEKEKMRQLTGLAKYHEIMRQFDSSDDDFSSSSDL